jgi:hypothetical protein
MKKIIFKLLPFTLPFVIFFLFNLYFGVINKGDLLRIGNLIDIHKNYRMIFDSHQLSDTLYSDFSKQDKRKYSILTIGDSFSQQGNIGYQNILATYDSTSVLHYNVSGIPLEELYNFINGDILDSVNFDFVILESIERFATKRAIDFDSTQVLNYNEAILRDEKAKKKRIAKLLGREKKAKFFSPSTVKFSLNNILYLFDDNAIFSDVYKVRTNNKLFSIEDSSLLFFKEDLKYTGLNNDLNRVKLANNNLNIITEKLRKKGIQLIVLFCPDKLDFYYNEIQENEKYPKPIFFENMEKVEKNYIYINSKKILTNAKQNTRDIYFYDDTHWSPIASKIIAKEIIEQVRAYNSTHN